MRKMQYRVQSNVLKFQIMSPWVTSFYTIFIPISNIIFLYNETYIDVLTYLKKSIKYYFSNFKTSVKSLYLKYIYWILKYIFFQNLIVRLYSSGTYYIMYSAKDGCWPFALLS